MKATNWYKKYANTAPFEVKSSIAYTTSNLSLRLSDGQRAMLIDMSKDEARDLMESLGRFLGTNSQEVK